MLVGVDDNLGLAVLDGDRNDLVREISRRHCFPGLALGCDGKLILLLAGDLILLGHILCCIAHVIAVEGIPQAVFDHGVDEVEIAHLLAIAQVRAVRRLAHALLAAGDDDIRVTELDRLHAHGDRPKAGAAELIDLHCRCFNRDARVDRSLACGILACARCQNLTQQNFIDVRGGGFGTSQGFLDGHSSKIGRGDSRQSAVERTDWRTRGARNDYFFHGMFPYRLFRVSTGRLCLLAGRGQHFAAMQHSWVRS